MIIDRSYNSAISLGVGVFMHMKLEREILFRCWTRKSEEASAYPEVGRISVKSVWCWVETEFSGILVCSEIKGPCIHRMGNVGARGIVKGKARLGQNLFRGHRSYWDGWWMPVWQQMAHRDGTGGRIATTNMASSDILPWVSVVSCHF